MNKKLTILKLGGSLLTDKSQPSTICNKILKEIAQEIKKCIDLDLIEDLIIIHGVGSIGHPPVLEYKLHHGFKNPQQLIPLSKTQLTVNKFRNLIAEEFSNVGLPVNLLHCSSMCISEKMQIKEFLKEPIEGFLSLGMIPLLGGDMIFDRKMGFSVGSGDQIAKILAKDFKAGQLIFATDVNGIYARDPKVFPQADFYSEISMDALGQIINDTDASIGKDASGSMKGKLQTINSLKFNIEHGLDISIISMKSPGNLTNYLKNISKKWTRFVP